MLYYSIAMRFFKKKKEERIEEEKELELRELEVFIANKIKEESDEVLKKARDIIEEIKAVIDPISIIGEEINAIKLDRHELASQYISAMNNAKRNLSAVIKNIKKSKLDVNNIEELDNVKRQVTSMLSKLGEVTGSHRRVIYELFPSHAKKLKAELERLKGYSEELNSLVENYKKRVDIYEDSKARILEIIRAERELVRIRAERDRIEDDIKELEKKRELLDRELDNSKEDKEYLEQKESLKRIRREYEQILDEISKLLSSVSRAINKYDYTLGIEKAKKKLLMDIIRKPSNIVNIDATLLALLFSDIIKAIKDKKIQLKSPEKDISILEELVNKLHTFATKAREYEKRIREIRETVRPLDIQLERLEENLRSIKGEIEQLDNKRVEYINKIKDLEGLIESNTITIKNELEKIMLKIKIKR